MAAQGRMPAVKVDGSDLKDPVARVIRKVVVESDGNGPDSCRIIFEDPGRNILSQAVFQLNTPLTVEATPALGGSPGKVFDGVIYAFGYEFDDQGSYATLVAYDRSYLLYNGVHTKVYPKARDSEVAQQIASEVGLTPGDIETSPVLMDIGQANETHYEFLSRRAAEIGYRLLVTGEKLHFKPAPEASEAPDPGDLQARQPGQLVPGRNLEQLSIRITGASQVSEVEVRGWDMRTKQAVTGTAQASTVAAELEETPAKVAGLFGSGKQVVVDVPYTTTAECDAAATAEAERLAGAMVHAEGLAYGDPSLLADTAVSLGLTGGRLDGKLTITSAKHIWGPRGYYTQFVASGGHARSSVLSLVSGGAGGIGHRRIDGLVTGVVTNVSDSEVLGQVKLKFPWLDDNYQTDWARVLQIGAGASRGFAWLPEVGDEVLVGFDQGDLRRPYVLGGVFNGVDKPPFPNAVDQKDSGKVDVRGWMSRSGHQFTFVDKAGEERIELSTKDAKVKMVLTVKDGSLQIDTEGPVNVAAKGDLKITTTKSFTLQADGDGTIKAKNLNLTGDSEVKVKAPKINLN